MITSKMLSATEVRKGWRQRRMRKGECALSKGCEEAHRAWKVESI